MDGGLLTLIFAASGLLAVVYYQALLPVEELRQRLPNKVTPAGIILAVVILGLVFWVWSLDAGFSRFRSILPIIYNLLVFETLFLILMRWLWSNTMAVLLGLILTTGLVYWQDMNPSVFVFNLTFLLVPLGATSLLIRFGYLRTRFLALVAILWTLYDVMATLVIYPRVFLPATEPIPSFLFPAVIAGHITLGIGDFVFLALFTLMLLRDVGQRAAWVHIAAQAVALFITVTLKPVDMQFPYLTVMTPIYFGVWWFMKRQAASRGSSGAAQVK